MGICLLCCILGNRFHKIFLRFSKRPTNIPYFAQEAIIPMRGAPTESAEMVSQLVFGEVCFCLSQQDNWWKIRNATDDYEGWVNPRMLWEITPEEYQGIQGVRFILSGNIYLQDQTHLRLPIGARIPMIGSDPNGFSLNGKTWSWNDDLVRVDIQAPEKKVELAQHFLNIPYVWGGRSGFGIDCSGFSQQLFAMCGIPIPRDSSKQGLEGISIPLGEQRAGDLAFFCKPNHNRISHVGMLVASDQIIHSSAKVRLDEFVAQGIRHKETHEITHQLLSIKRW